MCNNNPLCTQRVEGLPSVICPFDGLPCKTDCPDRYRDRPAGGCLFTDAQVMGAKIVPIDEASGTYGIVFLPD